MDIKWRNIKYKKGTKMSAVILAWLCFLSAFGGAIFLIRNDQVLISESFYSYPKNISNFSSHVVSVVDYYIWLKGAKSGSEIMESSKGEEESIISNKLTAFFNSTERLSKAVNLAYYIKNNETGEVITNVKDEKPIELLNRQRQYIYIIPNIDLHETNFTKIYRVSEVMEKMRGTSYEVHIAVIEPLKPGDEFYDDFTYYNRVKTISALVIPSMIIAFILLLATLIYLCYAAGKNEKGEKLPLNFLDRIYVDIHTLVVLILLATYAFCFIKTIDLYYDNVTRSVFSIIILLSLAFFTALTYSLSLVRQKRNGKALENILILKVLKKIKEFIKLCFNGKIFRVWILLLLPLYAFANVILACIAGAAVRYYSGIKVFYVIAFLLAGINAAAFLFTAKALKSLSIIMEGTKQISRGNLDYEMNSGRMSPVFAAFAENICNIQGGLKKAVDNAIKGERLKTELITNVSHDLKTPLTSIINYVDLMKAEKIESKKAKEYIGILEEKSARLKVLIEDLVEASKASSGNIAVNLKKVGLYELVMQAYGEYQEKAEKAGLDIRINASDKNILVRADGKHMWRILENLLSNILKYSMPGSRVYINISKSPTDGILTIKNISALPLEIPAEQLTERFVRGDMSRTTEGSGLGLSIAQSLANMQGGKLDIQIDGDLFKVIVEIPLWKE
ncbi:MAG: HAMP domain-containing histidine kinase [Clostridium sp.]|nr:HAMP domain-containing histidine kinase [Clostridium sp.]